MPTKLFLAIIVSTLVLSVSPAQQSSWDHYRPGTLQSLIDAHRENASETDFLVSARSFPSQVRLVYSGKSRPISGKRLELLRFWDKMDTTRESVMKFFKIEMLFREGKTEHWVVVQDPLPASLRKEVRPGEAINAFVIFMGAVKLEKRWQWLFAMNGFDDPPHRKASPTNLFPQSE